MTGVGREVRYNPDLRRHSWVKIREHYYQCRWCGLERYNHLLPDGSWVQRWRTTDGTVTTSQTGATLPTCDGPPPHARED